MGFLSNMKKNLTGSWADVTLVIEPALRRGDAVPVRVDVQVKDDDVTVTSVVVEVSCEEVIDARSVLSAASSGPITQQTMSTEVQEVLHQEEVVLASGLALSAGSTSSYEGSVRLPEHAPGSARGRHAEFRWTARARLDMKGNDPDSGWTTLEVS